MINEVTEMAQKAGLPVYIIEVRTERFGFSWLDKRLVNNDTGEMWKIKDFLKQRFVRVQWNEGEKFRTPSVGTFAKQLCERTDRSYVESTEYTLDKERTAWRATELYKMLDYPFLKAFISLEYDYTSENNILNLKPVAMAIFKPAADVPQYLDYMKLSMFHRYLGQKTYTTDVDYVKDGLIWEFKQKRPRSLSDLADSEKVLWNFADLCGYDFFIAYCVRTNGDYIFEIPYLSQVIDGIDAFKRYKKIK